MSSLLSVCRRANLLNTAWPLTDLSWNHAAVPPAPALTCMWRRPVKLSSHHLDNISWAQITQTPNPSHWKIMTRDTCWTWNQVQQSKFGPCILCILQVMLVSCGSAVICSCRFLPRWFSAVWWILACIRVCSGHSSAYERERSMKIFALCAILPVLTVAGYTFLIPAVVQAKAGLLGEPSGDHRWHTGHPCWLDGGSCSGIQAALRDAAPLHQLRGPLPLPDDEHETEQAAACWHGSVGDRCVSGCLHIFDTALFRSVPIDDACCRKYGEITPPKLDDFVYTTDDTYSRNQLMHMELLVLKTLRYRMTAPTVNHFLSLFMTIQPACPLTQNLAMVSRTHYLWVYGHHSLTISVWF